LYEGKIIHVHDMNEYVVLVVESHSFLNSALHEGQWPALGFGRFTPEKVSGTHFIGGWVGDRAIFNTFLKSVTYIIQLKP
jgi:hypothetical protein